MLGFNAFLASLLIPIHYVNTWNQETIKELLELQSGQKRSQNKKLKELCPELGSSLKSVYLKNTHYNANIECIDKLSLFEDVENKYWT